MIPGLNGGLNGGASHNKPPDTGSNAVPAYAVPTYALKNRAIGARLLHTLETFVIATPAAKAPVLNGPKD